jgi:hypothetical protein
MRVSVKVYNKKKNKRYIHKRSRVGIIIRNKIHNKYWLVKKYYKLR